MKLQESTIKYLIDKTCYLTSMSRPKYKYTNLLENKNLPENLGYIHKIFLWSKQNLQVVITHNLFL